MTAFVAVRELSLIYPAPSGDVTALRSLDLEVPRGQLVCIRGRSGSGKSSLLHVLSALRRASAGTARVGDLDLGTLGAGDAALYRRRRCGIVFQSFNLLEMLTVAENIEFPLALDGLPEREIRARVDPLLCELGLEGRRDHLPDQLSGGEQQRVAVARALAIRPDLVLADEPTGNLDSATGAHVWACIRDSCRRQGVTTILATHDADATGYVDRVVELSDGRIVRDTGAELLAPRPVDRA